MMILVSGQNRPGVVRIHILDAGMIVQSVAQPIQDLCDRR